MTAMYRLAQIFPCVGVPWTLWTALIVAILISPGVPPWDRAAIYSGARWIDWSLIVVPLFAIAGTAIAARVLKRTGARRSRAVCTLAGNAIVAIAYVPIWGLLFFPPPPPQSDYPRGLDRTPRLPTDRPEYGPEYLLYSRYTADEMNRLAQDPDGRANLLWRSAEGPLVTYVPADVASDGPLVVSVNPIDDYTWGAAALSDRTGRCYLFVSVRDPENPKYGHLRYGRLTDGRPCKGSEATRDSTRGPGRDD